ncbi:hypothetical protein [Breznakiella homolactica]|uniref:Outer membrane protein beta-barrel domain-containing protein n=1 Tax=Breznakiella homolactica TaxID=2798577 RepID=A0A7T7XNE8_9SPIR|nr:hypothetical protein [Breznakiella homolactica]QQO09564.1 hypothetical protein JFL75_01195 [Breznakiella homolactica]
MMTISHKALLLFVPAMILSGAIRVYPKPYISGAAAEIAVVPEINRSLGYCWNITAKGTLELNKLLEFSGGAALGQEGTSAADVFARAGAGLPFFPNLSFHAAYIFNTYPGYNTRIHSVIPAVRLRLWRIEAVLGYCFRVTVFGSEDTLAERNFAYRAGIKLIDSDRGNFSVHIGNVSDFFCGNLGSYSLGFSYSVPVSRRISISGGMELYQTGSIALASNNYGTALKGGVVFCFQN